MKHTLITIEGTDGSGKKTQTQKLYDFLKSEGHEVICLSFPNYESPSSAPVKMYLSGELGEDANCLSAYQASTIYAVDRLCTITQLLSKLSKDTIIIFDRYTQSNMIHQASKIISAHKKRKFLKWLDNFEFGILGLPRVDKTIFLDVPVSISKKISQDRTQQKIGAEFTRDIHEQDTKHLQSSYDNAKYIAKQYKWTTINCIDENSQLKSIEHIHELIKNEVVSILPKKASAQ